MPTYGINAHAHALIIICSSSSSPLTTAPARWTTLVLLAGRSVVSLVALQSALQQHQKKCTHNSIIKRTLRLLIARIAGGGGKTIARLSAWLSEVHVSTITCCTAFYRALQDTETILCRCIEQATTPPRRVLTRPARTHPNRRKLFFGGHGRYIVSRRSPIHRQSSTVSRCANYQ